jgi:hypothetical protein
VRRSGQGLDASFAAFRGEEREFFLDILFHRMSAMAAITLMTARKVVGGRSPECFESSVLLGMNIE